MIKFSLSSLVIYIYEGEVMAKQNVQKKCSKKKTSVVKKSKIVNKKVSKNKAKKKYNKEDVKVTIKLIVSLVTIMVCAVYIISVYEQKSLLDIIHEVATEAEAMITEKSDEGKLIRLGSDAVPAAYRPNNQPEFNATKNSYDWTNLYGRNDFRYYYSGKKVVSNVGIDVSYYQEKIDWNRVKKAGVDFAIIRLGFRGYKNGSLVLDTRYKYNMEHAKRAGIKVGVYFFSQALTKAEAVEEAQFCIKYVKKYDLDYPIVIDTEAINNKSARSHATELNPNELTEVCKAFCNTVNKAGYKSSIYASKSWFLYKLNLERLEGYNKWLAHYTKATDYVYDFDMWQYTSDGHVPGIKGRVDMNIGLQNIG